MRRLVTILRRNRGRSYADVLVDQAIVSKTEMRETLARSEVVCDVWIRWAVRSVHCIEARYLINKAQERHLAAQKVLL